MNPTFPSGSWSPNEFLNLQRAIARPKLIRLNFFYIIREILEHRCLKWACITHLGTWNISYGQKKGRKSNCRFDSWPLKVENCPDFLVCRWHAIYRCKFLDEGYNFASDLISIAGLHMKLWADKFAKVLISRISGLQLGSPGTKWHLGASPVAKHRKYYKGEGGGFRQVWAIVSLVSPCLPVARLCIKSAPPMH
jgi:hypothetical protein